MKKVLEFVEKIKNAPGIKAIILFGSRATGRSRPSSDWDVAIILDPINPNLEASISSMAPRDVDVVFFHRAPLYVKANILRDGKILVNNDPEFLKKIWLETMTQYLDNKELYVEVY